MVAGVEALTIGKILGLAAIDAVNPCALAVLTLVLISILTANPKSKKNVLFGGLLFSLSVLILYFIYGAIFINLFKVFVTGVKGVQPFLYGGLAVVAIFLGILNIKDFVKYKAGSLCTEMPMSMRPKVKSWIDRIISPLGAFIIGAFVTVFLLPCTIGPYIIASGILSSLPTFLHTIPWLLIYNLVFILPMVAITIIIYIGYSSVEKVSGWKEKNIKILHLITGILMCLIGIYMIYESWAGLMLALGL